jgi:hypothetical protein
MKIISKNPLCFTVSLEEIEKNNMILSPEYYIEKEEHHKLNEWFLKLTLKQKNILKSYYEYLKKEGL